MDPIEGPDGHSRTPRELNRLALMQHFHTTRLATPVL